MAPLIEVGAWLHPELTGREKMYLNSSIMGQLFAQLRKREKRNIIDVRRPKKEKLSFEGCDAILLAKSWDWKKEEACYKRLSLMN